MSGRQSAIFGGGCFWCLEAVFQGLRGVTAVMSGYMGGHVARPSYEQVCGKNTGHAEVVRIEFDPAVIDYPTLLTVFFAIHDPTTRDRQGNDVGPQYRSVIFALNADQMTASEQMIHTMRPSFSNPIVTQLAAAFDVATGAPSQATEHVFWPAEPEHHDYFRRHPGQGYCMFVVAPKVAKAKAEFSALLA